MKEHRRGITVVTKSSNPHLELIERLRDRGERDRRKLFFAEGVRALARAVETRHLIESIVFVPHRLNHPYAHRLLDRLRSTGVSVSATSAEMFLRISRTEEPQWVGLIARQRWTLLTEVDATRGLCWVLLESIRSAGNLGSILRTSHAVGAVGVIAVGGSVDPYDPAAVRASMSSLFATTLIRTNPAELGSWALRIGAQMVATSPGASLDFRQVSYRSPLVVLIGGERRGLSAALKSRSHVKVRIPMIGTADSLNVAVATGVMLSEVQRQRSGFAAGQ